MNPQTQKLRFFSDLYVIRKSKIVSFRIVFNTVLLFFLFFVSGNFLKVNASSVLATLQQKPTTKTSPKTSAPTSKVDKNKLKTRLNKDKKKPVIKKDTLQDIDPANVGTPLFKNEN
jgi:hypothetical protein